MQMIRFLAGLALVTSLDAQTEPYFPKPSYFRKHFARIATHVELQPPVRLSDFVAGGTLELSIRNYLDLVMANNPDVGVQKVTVEFSRSAISRPFGDRQLRSHADANSIQQLVSWRFDVEPVDPAVLASISATA